MIRTTTRRSRLFARRILLAVFALSLTSAIVPLAVAPATASPTNVLKVTGALKGTLKIVPSVNCTGVSPIGVILEWKKSLVSPSQGASTGLNISTTTTRYGTFTKFGIGTNEVDMVLDGSWIGIKGTVTKNAKSGSVNVTLERAGTTQTAHLAGSWNCG